MNESKEPPRLVCYKRCVAMKLELNANTCIVIRSILKELKKSLIY